MSNIKELSLIVEIPKYWIGETVVYDLKSSGTRQGRILDAWYAGGWSYRVSVLDNASVEVGEGNIYGSRSDK